MYIQITYFLNIIQINAHSGSAKLGNFTKPIATTLKAAQAYMRMRNVRILCNPAVLINWHVSE